jgi:hypothetical protein
MDVTMEVFSLFLRYKKMNKIKSIEIFSLFLRYKEMNKIRSIEIIFQKKCLSKAIIINLSKMKKSNENRV